MFKYKVNLTELRKQLNIKEFRTATKEWVEFVMMNRYKLVKTRYDIIIGPTADAKANAILKGYYGRYMACGCKVTDSDYRILKEQLKVNRYGTQICLKTQRAVDIFNKSRVEV